MADQQQAARGASALVDNVRWGGYLCRMSAAESARFADAGRSISLERRSYYLRLFQPTQRPRATAGEWIQTSWGRCRVLGRLGQRHADLLEAMLFVAERSRETDDGAIELLVDPARVRRTLSDHRHSLGRIREWLRELTHRRSPDKGWKLDGLIKVVGGVQGSQAMRAARRRIRQDGKGLSAAGVVLDGKRVNVAHRPDGVAHRPETVAQRPGEGRYFRYIRGGRPPHLMRGPPPEGVEAPCAAPLQRKHALKSGPVGHLAGSCGQVL